MDGSVTLVTCAQSRRRWEPGEMEHVGKERPHSQSLKSGRSHVCVNLSSRHEQSSRKRNKRRAPTPSAFSPFTRRIIASSSSEGRFRDFWLQPSTLTYSLKPFARSEDKYQLSEKLYFFIFYSPPLL